MNSCIFLLIKLCLLIHLILNLAQAETNCAQVTEIPQAECEALLRLYHRTNGPNWDDNEGWNVSHTPCSWKGVICENGVVQQLILRYNQLSGSLPEFIALTQLRVIDLWENNLKGPIPEYSSLTQLRYLDLSSNQLSGPIAEFTPLTQLHYLNLSSNQLNGAIPKFATLTQLEILFLDNNLLGGFIPDITHLTQLQQLDFSDNHLSGPIPELTTTPNLKFINLSNNYLSGMLPQFFTLTRLQQLNLSHNQLSGPLPEFKALTQLQEFNLSNNQLAGPIPEWNTFTQLQQLDLSNNQLSGPFPHFIALTELQHLSLNNNQLCGAFPVSLTQLEQLSRHSPQSDLSNNHCFTTEPSMIEFLDAKNIVWQPQKPALPHCVPQYRLTVKKLGQGNGTISADKGDLYCGYRCSVFYEQNSQITLTAVADNRSVFVGWNDPRCNQTLTMNRFLTCEAHFNKRSAPCPAAIYSNATRQALLPVVEIPTDLKANQTFERYTATLELQFGFSNVQVKALSFLETAFESNPCYAHFTPATGILEIPQIELPTLIYFGGQFVSGLPLMCQATLKQSLHQSEVLQLTTLKCQ